MTNRFIIAVASSGIWALLAAPLALCEGEAAGTPSFDKYKVITDHNIFLRDRPRPVRITGVRPPPPPPLPSPFTLTGVIRQGNEYVAFIEQTGMNVTSRVRLGETIADGRVSRITLDGIVYEKDGKTAEVGLGQRLSGSDAGTSAADSESPNTGTTVNQGISTAPPASTEPTGGDMNEVLRRLREKRQMEMNKK